MLKRYGLLLTGILVGFGVFALSWYFLSGDYEYQGSLIDPPVPAADFELNDQYGNPYRLSDQKGKIILIFFGYTNCPDVCPVTLSEFKNIKKALGDKSNDVEFVFITVDPERDNKDHLNKYLSRFDPAFIGLSEDRSVLEQVWADYGVYQEQIETESAIGYLVDHSSRTYVIDSQGNWKLTYPFGIETRKIIQDLNHMLQNS